MRNSYVNQTEPSHFVAGSVAIFLMVFGLILVVARNRIRQVVAISGLAMMAPIYLAAVVAVARLGSPRAAVEAHLLASKTGPGTCPIAFKRSTGISQIKPTFLDIVPSRI